MRIIIISRSGDRFPNIISKGLLEMIQNLGFEGEIIYEIPFLMRSLPLNEKPVRWEANIGFRLREKIKYFIYDYKLKKKLAKSDLIIVSECFANLFWRNYIYVEVLRKISKAKIVSYTDGPLDSAPEHKLRWLTTNDFDETRFDYNLFVTDKIERKLDLNANQFKIGVKLTELNNFKFTSNIIQVLFDFDQEGFEQERELQIKAVESLGIQYRKLIGKYSNKEIRKIYSESNLIFLSFPETFGLSIAEALYCGCRIIIPDRSWVMSWDLYEKLPECFVVYNSDNIIDVLRKESESTNYSRDKVQRDFLEKYPFFLNGNKNELEKFLIQFL
jgi:hypothetical protein